MTTDIIKKEDWENRLELVRNMFAQGSTDQEFKLYCYLAKRFKLDPFKKEIWCVKYGNSPAAIFAGRDGFLKIAHDSLQFSGMKTFSINKKGQEVSICLNKDDLMGAICYVYRKDCIEPFICAVALHEYSTGKSNWARMPETMLKKVAQSQALRQAFSAHGLYSPEEIDENTIIQRQEKTIIQNNLVQKKEEKQINEEPNKKSNGDSNGDSNGQSRKMSKEEIELFNKKFGENEAARVKEYFSIMESKRGKIYNFCIKYKWYWPAIETELLKLEDGTMKKIFEYMKIGGR